MIVDLRSDTVTKPTKEMLETMFSAQVGDDVFVEDPTINKLEEKSAQLFGFEAGLFCPSGTMTNQIAIKVHSNPPGEVICDFRYHIYQYEGGGIGFNSGLSARLIYSKDGLLTANQIEECINPDDVHKAETQLVSLEDTCNRGGGNYYDIEEVKKIKDLCNQYNLPLHLDGARIFNALVETGVQPNELSNYYNSVSVCLSKGLGCPVGSVLLGNKDFIKKARRIRKIFGGGMRQGGFMAAAGIYALDNNISRLKDDHKKAKEIANTLKNLPFVKHIETPPTNIVIYQLEGNIAKQQVEKLKEKGILAYPITPDSVRMVTHLDITDEMVEYTCKQLANSL